MNLFQFVHLFETFVFDELQISSKIQIIFIIDPLEVSSYLVCDGLELVRSVPYAPGSLLCSHMTLRPENYTRSRWPQAWPLLLSVIDVYLGKNIVQSLISLAEVIIEILYFFTDDLFPSMNLRELDSYNPLIFSFTIDSFYLCVYVHIWKLEDS